MLDHRLIKGLQEKVADDLATLDDKALDRLISVCNYLPSDHTSGLIPASSRLMTLIKVEQTPHEKIVGASVHELNRMIMEDSRKALVTVSEGNLPFVSLGFIENLDELE